jgi:hypothetical protein
MGLSSDGWVEVTLNPVVVYESPLSYALLVPNVTVRGKRIQGTVIQCEERSSRSVRMSELGTGP